IPQLARNGTMRLVQRLAVICVRTTPHFTPKTFLNLYEPVGVSQGLTRKADNISLSALKNFFGLLKRGYPSRRHHRRLEAGGVDSPFDCRNQRQAATKWTSLVREHGRHALITALTGVRVNGLAHLRLLCIFEFATLRDRQEVKAGAGKFHGVVDCVLN